MNRKDALKVAPAPPQQPSGRGHRTYSIAQICELLKMPQRTFFDLRTAGKLPFLSELRPRLGRRVRYRADLVDRYLAGEWQQPRVFGRSHGQNPRSLSSSAVSPTFRQTGS